MNNDINEKIALCVDLDSHQWNSLDRYIEIVREASQRMSLVSRGDVELLWEHVGDSLSLLGGICEGDEGFCLDIGSGAGFPAIPLAIALPERDFLLIERRSKRCGYLHMVLNQLGLANVRLCEGSFPNDVREFPGIVTARAVEKPTNLLAGLRPLIAEGAVFLSQNGDLSRLLADTFHVEQIVDNWGEQGLRRGDLWRIYSETASSVPRGTLA